MSPPLGEVVKDLRQIHTQFINDLQNAVFDNVDESNKLGVELINCQKTIQSLDEDMNRLRSTLDQLDEV